MIRQISTIQNNIFEELSRNHYSLRLKSHYKAYGASYDFCRFFEMVTDNVNAIICLFNSSMVLATKQNVIITSDIIDDIAIFISMNKPESVEMNVKITDKLFPKISEEYLAIKRMNFEFKIGLNKTNLNINETPRLDDVYKVLAESYPTIKSSYDLWLTDTSHRIRRGLSQVFLLEKFTTATIQYIIDDVALVGNVATLSEFRGKHYARELLFWIGQRLSNQGIKVHLFAREHRVSYYQEIGFSPTFTDIVFERKSINE